MKGHPDGKGGPILVLVVGSICCQSAPRSRTRPRPTRKTSERGIRWSFPSRKSVTWFTDLKEATQHHIGVGPERTLPAPDRRIPWSCGRAARAAGRTRQRSSPLRGRDRVACRRTAFSAYSDGLIATGNAHVRIAVPSTLDFSQLYRGMDARVCAGRQAGMPAGSQLRDVVRQRIENGRLPVNTPRRVNAGRGWGQLCAACDRQITSSDALYDFEDIRSGKRLRFHSDCYNLWRESIRPHQR
jgi:hypothetical protein